MTRPNGYRVEHFSHICNAGGQHQRSYRQPGEGRGRESGRGTTGLQNRAREADWEGPVRDGGSSNTRFDLDRAHSYDVGVLLATLTYYSNSKQIVDLMKIGPGG